MWLPDVLKVSDDSQQVAAARSATLSPHTPRGPDHTQERQQMSKSTSSGQRRNFRKDGGKSGKGPPRPSPSEQPNKQKTACDFGVAGTFASSHQEKPGSGGRTQQKTNNGKKKKKGSTTKDKVQRQQTHKELENGGNDSQTGQKRTPNNSGPEQNATGRIPKSNRKQQLSRSRQNTKYSPYLSYGECLRKYAAHEVIRGKLRVLPGKDSSAFVTCDRGSLARDAIVQTQSDRNRAIDGDIVFIELLPEDDENTTRGRASSEVDGNNIHSEESSINEQPKASLSIQESGSPSSQLKTWQDDDEQMRLWNPLVSVPKIPDPTAVSASHLRLPDNRKARVVHVVPPKMISSQPSELNPSKHQDYKPRRKIVGTLKRVASKTGSMHLLTPTNRSLPQFLTPSSFSPVMTSTVRHRRRKGSGGDDDSIASDDDESGLYVADYVYGTWKAEHNWPPCTNVQLIGKSCNVENETLALLEGNGVNHGEFDGSVLRELHTAVESGLRLQSEQQMGWSPTPDMYEGRRDYRKQRIFTIDPTTAKDLDDALHITELDDGRVEIGVHIADVSYFVRPDSAVDVEAQRRATTVYLVDRVIPMLPKPLCEIACSLNENVERLAFSCVWRMNQDGTLENPKGKTEGDEVWYGRSVIKSCARLDYATAQNIIDGEVATGDEGEQVDEDLWPKSRRPTGGHTIEQVANDVRLMHKVAMARRQLRFRNGAVMLNGVKLAFELGEDGETPLLCAPYPIRDSNRLVEEYMLLANYLVAQRLITHAGGLALLRHHPPPVMTGLQEVVEVAKAAKGFHIDATSSQMLQESLNRLGRECDDELLLQCVTVMLMTPMNAAEYMTAGEFGPEEWKHYALNIPYYTHFTSPIRRYADVIVHRLLQATIDGPDAVEIFPLEQKEIQSTCSHCNEKKLASKAAQDRSDVLFLALYLKRNPLRHTMGVVLSVGEKTFKVFVPSLGIASKVFLDEHKDALKSTPVKEGECRVIQLENKASTGWRSLEIRVFTKLQVTAVCKERPPIDVKIKFEAPWTGE